MAKDLKYIRKRKRTYGYAYLVDIPYNDDSGTLKHFTATFKVIDYGSDQTALIMAQKARNEALLDIQSGKIRTTFPTVNFLYENKFRLMPLASSTRAKQDSIFPPNVGELGNKTIDKVTIADIQTCINQYAESHSDDSIHRFVSIWRQIYKVAQILEYPITDKTTALVIPKSKMVSAKKDVRLSAGELQIVLDELIESGEYDDIVMYYLLMIMYYTGMRPAECLALTRNDIHDTYISITKQIGSTSKKRLQIVPTKTEGSRRNVPIPHDLEPILDDLINWSSNEILLSKRNGTPQDISKLSYRISRISKKHGINFFAYKLRHQMSTDLMHAGDSVVARDLLGHTSFAMTLDYARSTDEQLYSAIVGRTLAESQPKTKRHDLPPMTISKRYAILQFQTAVRLCIMAK